MFSQKLVCTLQSKYYSFAPGSLLSFNGNEYSFILSSLLQKTPVMRLFTKTSFLWLVLTQRTNPVDSEKDPQPFVSKPWHFLYTIPEISFYKSFLCVSSNEGICDKTLVRW